MPEYIYLILHKFQNSASKFVIHMAAFTDVSKAWEQKGDQNGAAYQINVVGTQNIITACQKTDKHLIHISTAYVFDGAKEGLYTEDDRPRAIEWYGQTKLEAEKLIQESEINWTILRIDQPFRSDSFAKVDIAHRIIEGLQSGNLYPQFVDHYFGPTFIDDFARVLDCVIRKKLTGLYHASAGEKWSDYDFASLIRETRSIASLPIKKGHLADYLKTMSRPYQKNTAMSCEKLKLELDFKMKTVEEAVGSLTSPPAPLP